MDCARVQAKAAARGKVSVRILPCAAVCRNLQLEFHGQIKAQVVLGDRLIVSIRPLLLETRVGIDGVGHAAKINNAAAVRGIARPPASGAVRRAVLRLLQHAVFHLFRYTVSPGLAAGGVALQLAAVISALNGESPLVVVSFFILDGIIRAAYQFMPAAFARNLTRNRQAEGVVRGTAD